MRIGVDATSWAHGRGYGRFIRELLPVMVRQAPDDEFLCFVDRRSAERFDLVAPNVKPRVVDLAEAPTEAASADGARGPLDMLRLTAAVWHERPDVLFLPTVYTYFPLPPGQKAVVTIHDAIAERFPELTLPTARARLFWRMKVALALHQARLVLTVSQHAAGELAEVLGVPRGAIRVAVEAPARVYQTAVATDRGRALRTLGLPEGARWFTYVGGFSPHKRVDAIVRAHAAMVRAIGRERAPYLVLVGALSGDAFLGDQPAIRDAIEEGGAKDLVRWTGFLSDDDLCHVHGAAVALLLPSLAEGFGLPAVEAAARGCPVIATTASPLPELLAGGGVFVGPRDDAALRSAMRFMATDEPARQAMARQAEARARALTWDAAASAALGAIREAA